MHLHDFGFLLFEANFIQNGKIHGSLVLCVLDGVLFENFVRLRLEIIHERLQWEL